MLNLENHFVVGDVNGRKKFNYQDITMIDTRRKNEIELLKLRSKVMKLEEANNRIVAASYEGSFCVFDLKP